MPSEPTPGEAPAYRGRRLHGFSVVSRALRLARQLIIPAIIGGASAGGGLPGVLGWITVILAVPSFGIAVLQWLAFRFRLQDDDLVIDSGVLSRRRRVIPLARVQNIDVEQNALERLFGVAELRLETASGGGETEASLNVLAHAEARALQSELMRRRHARTTSPLDALEPLEGLEGLGALEADLDSAGIRAAVADPVGHGADRDARRLIRLSPADLALAGATSNEAGLIAAGLATAIGVLSDFAATQRVADAIEDAVMAGAALGVLNAALAILTVIVAVVLAGWVVSIGANVVRFHGFTLTREGGDLRREYGLLSRHRSTVPLERVQAVRIEQTLLRRPLGLVALKIETAGAGPQQQADGSRAEAFVPIARRAQVGPLLAEVFPDARFDDVRLNGVSPVSRRRGFFRLAAPIALATAVAGVVVGTDGLWLLALALPAWWLAGAQYRARAWARPPGYTLARAGVFTRTTWVVPERKIQTIHLRESPFQRRWHLATLLVDTAAGGRIATVVDLERDTGLDLLAGIARHTALAAARGSGKRRTAERGTAARGTSTRGTSTPGTSSPSTPGSTPESD